MSSEYDREHFERKRLERELRDAERELPPEFKPDAPLHLRIRTLVDLSQKMARRVKIQNRDSIPRASDWERGVRYD